MTLEVGLMERIVAKVQNFIDAKIIKVRLGSKCAWETKCTVHS